MNEKYPHADTLSTYRKHNHMCKDHNSSNNSNQPHYNQKIPEKIREKSLLDCNIAICIHS